MKFDDVKQMLLEAVDEAKTVEELIDIVIYRIYNNGFHDGVEVGKRIQTEQR